jgi:hypothetical protein
VNGNILKKFNISQKVLAASMLMFFSGLLIFFDESGSFMYGIPRELIIPIYLLQLLLAPLYLKRYKTAYIIGIITAIFVAFTYRDNSLIARTIPIIQYFLGFSTFLAYRETLEITKRISK